MTVRLSRERLEALANIQSLECMALPASHAESAEMARMLLAGMDSEPVAYISKADLDAGYPHILARRDFNKACPMAVYAAPPAPVVDDYFAALVTQARERANKAMRKFPQPNYVLNKVAEESGEVIKAVIHYTEGREEWRNVEGEIIDNLAMLIRLVQEGDQVIGFTPPTDCRAAMLKAGPVTRWIKCSERMPDLGHDMIVFADGIVMSGISYNKKKGFYIQALGYDDDENIDNVTHWMPLPAAPEQE